VTADIALAVDDLLVGQDGLKVGAPPYRSLVNIGEAVLKELKEDPLGPAVVTGVGGVYFTVPVDGETEALDLATEVLDVGLGGDGRVGPGLDGILLGRKTERVPTHGVQHVVTGGFLVAGQDVRGGVAFRVADVEPCA
jgi:hypothetical protein